MTSRNRLSDLGRREEALAAAEEAVSLFRDLAAGRPGGRTSHRLAMSLNTFSNALGDVHRLEEALAAAEEAVALREALSAGQPDETKNELAVALNNLSVRLEALGLPSWPWPRSNGRPPSSGFSRRPA